MRKRHSFDMDALLRTIILLGFLLLLARLIQTRELYLFIAPRFQWLTELTCYILLLMTVVQATHIVSGKHTQHCGCNHHQHTVIYIPFVLTLLMAVLIPNGVLNANIAANKGLNAQPAASATNGAPSVPRPLAAALSAATLIQVTDQNYSEVMSELNDFPGDYAGKKIDMVGFVFKDPSFPASQLALVRYVIVCCSADALPYGIQCEFNTANQYAADTWLHIRGTVQLGHYQEKTVPVIKVSAVSKVEQPARPYVFPPN